MQKYLGNMVFYHLLTKLMEFLDLCVLRFNSCNFCNENIQIFKYNMWNELLTIMMINGGIYWAHLLEIIYFHERDKNLQY